MFFAKEKLSEVTELKVEINTENVFCHCPVCGREVPVDLGDLFSGDEDVDLYSTSVLCSNCSKSIIKKGE